MKVLGEFIKIIKADASYKDGELYSEKELEAALGQAGYDELLGKGVDVFKAFIAKNPDGFADLKSGFVDLYRVFTHFLKEERTGLLKGIEFRNGYMKMSSNLPLPCALIEGVIKGMLLHLKTKGASIKHTKCRTNGFKNCEFEINWMITHV